MEYPHTIEIRNLLKDKADFVQNEGLNYLIPTWHRFSEEYAHCEDSIFEWRNDLDTRNIIGDILSILTENERTKIETVLKPIDDKVILKTFEVNECIWGKIVEEENKYNHQKNWYYYRVNQKLFDIEEGLFTKK